MLFGKKQILTVFLVALVALFVAACEGAADPDPTIVPTVVVPTDDPTLPTATTEPVSTDDMSSEMGFFIETIDVTNTDGRIDVTLTGNLPDACTEIQTVEQTFDLDTNTFNLNVRTERPEDVACAQVLTPFEETVTLQTADLPAGTYQVAVEGETQTLTETFELTTADQQPSDAVASISPTTGTAGTAVQLTASGLPANAQVELGVGLVASEYDIVASAMTDANGNLNALVQIPETAEANNQWVVVVEGPSGAKTISNEFNVVASDTGDGGDTGAQFDETQIYLIALEDDGQSGEPVGCGDSAVPVTIDIEPTIAPLTAALENMFAIDEQYYGQSGLYNALYQSNLSVQGIDINNRHATIALTGDLQAGGTCDVPRIEAQLTETALQYSTIDTVSITVNGQPLNELLSAAGS
ncbi:MAG: GerMN domain-containing protein [Anaerolineaceae bacterium]|nr:GerMN domain-containing protein [Anaerolineaceae bacterium]